MKNRYITYYILSGILLFIAFSIPVFISYYSLSGYTFIISILLTLLTFVGIRFLENQLVRKYYNREINSLTAKLSSLSEKKLVINPSTQTNDFSLQQFDDVLEIIKQDRAAELKKLRDVDVYRREYLGNVSHELKTPIFNVQGYLHSLIDGGLDDKEVHQYYLEKASMNLDRLINIVDDLESISMLESGKLNLEFRIFDIHDLIRDVIEHTQMMAGDKNIQLIFDDQGKVQQYVKADKDKIRQVLINLVVNSIKYGKNDGQTIIKTLLYKNTTIIVEVEDNGIGISTEHQARLFERFYRVDRSRSRAIGGTGLGLAIVKHIIEAHQQTVNVKSEPGKGSTFTFTLEYSKA